MSGKGDNIVLIGFMGSGKTTVGLKLSYRLRMSVEDTDKLIERRQGMSISEIFEKEGEEAFRRMETELIGEIADQNYQRIFSVGGGTPVRQENRELLKKCGMVVYLRVRPETVYERLRGDATRPLLQCADPLERIRELLVERQAAYEECADVTVDVDDISMEEILELITDAWKRKAALTQRGVSGQTDATGEQCLNDGRGGRT